MPSELINIHVGGCGLNFGNVCWKTYCKQHGISIDGYSKYQDEDRIGDSTRILFNASSKNKYVPRCLFVDCLDDENSIRSSDTGNLYSPMSFCQTNEDSGYSAHIGYSHTELSSKSDFVICKLMETADSLQGFLVCNSLGGGLGSGFTSRILESLVDIAPKAIKALYSVLPGKNRVCGYEDLNASLGFRKSNKAADIHLLYSNEALFDILGQLQIENPTKRLMNLLLAHAKSTTTYSQRFQDGLSWNLHGFQTNLIPWPSCNLITMNFAPLIPKSFQGHSVANISSLIQEVFEPENSFVTVDEDPQYISMALTFEGASANRNLYNAMKDKQSQFVPWCRNGVKFGFVNHNSLQLSETPLGQSTSNCTSFFNSTIASNAIRNIQIAAERLLDTGAYMHIFAAAKEDLMKNFNYIEDLADCYKNCVKEELVEDDLHFHFQEKQYATLKRTGNSK